MRPVNLIPKNERTGGRAPMRAGGASYVLLAALAVALLGVIALALTSKQISDKRDDREQLERDLADATARADSLRPFADFAKMQEARTATVASLAQSRFDWERVMRELALIIPDDVWLINLTGTVSPGVSVEDAADVSIRDTVEGPALELIGCAAGEDSVAAFLAALEDIDGVTRVGMQTSEQPDSTQSAATGAGGASGAGEAGDDCRTRDFISRFEIVVAFDAVPTPAAATAAPPVPAPTAPGGTEPQLANSTTDEPAPGGPGG